MSFPWKTPKPDVEGTKNVNKKVSDTKETGKLSDKEDKTPPPNSQKWF